jgi:uncharacterized protein
MDADQTGYAFNVTRQSFLATQLTVADTHYARLVGLVGRPKSRFVRGAGLWIVPCHGVHTMFMHYPIDVVYLDDEKRVIRIEHSVSPWRVTPVLVEAATVLELPAHTAWDTGTMLGDQIEIKVGRGIRDGDRITTSA